jgi:hypothetical protein
LQSGNWAQKNAQSSLIATAAELAVAVELCRRVEIKAGKVRTMAIRPAQNELTAAARTAAAAFSGLVAIPAEDRAVATRLERHSCRLPAT